MIRTRFTEILGLTSPLMSAPMSTLTGARIAGAVSSAGALGSFGAWNAAKGPEWISAEASSIRAATSAPFGVGFISQLVSIPLFEAALTERVPVIFISFHDPRRWVEKAKQAGSTVICQVQTLTDADLAVNGGADILVAQGAEAGGHTGQLGLLPFLTATVDRFPDVPVLAAGGITNGRSLAAAMTAGADGAVLGTAFLATREAIDVPDAHKQLIIGSDGTDTVVTRAYDVAAGIPWPAGIGMRTRRNRFTDEWDRRGGELVDLHAPLVGEGDSYPLPVGPPDLETYPFPYGQGAYSVTTIKSAAEVIETVCNEAEEILRSRPPSLLA